MPKINRQLKPLNFIARLLGILILIIFATLIILKNKEIRRNNFYIKPASKQISNAKPFFSTELIPQPSSLLSAHSATLTRFSNGDLLALWFAGSHEGKPDVKIWQSIYTNHHWQMATIAVSPQSLQDALGEYVYKLGNPVVYRALNGKLHLFVVSVTIGGWAGSRVNHFVSNDNGKTWKFSRLLILSPLLNFSTLVRTNPVTLVGGGFYLPVYNEFTMTYPEILQFDDNGNFVRQQRMTLNRDSLLQPSIVPLSADTAITFLRNKALKNDKLYIQKTYDGGVSWGGLSATNLTNHDSSLVVVKLDSKLLLMVHNAYKEHSSEKNYDDRGCLALAVSEDGVTWRDIYDLEHDGKDEFSYPAIFVNDDTIDILYTWKRKQIKHVRFNHAWLMEHVL